MGGTHNVNIMVGKVVSVEGESCTVQVNGRLELTDIRLKATINGKEEKVMLTPKIGSYVLLGSLTGDEKDMTLLKMDEMEKMEYHQDQLSVTINSTDNSVLIDADGTVIELNDRVKVRNKMYSLLELIHEFIDICKGEHHMTNAGPTVQITPMDALLFEEIKDKFSELLKD